ncbi:MAG: hypothetical protein Roseis2KO_52090 [Roseivirga sp.]
MKPELPDEVLSTYKYLGWKLSAYLKEEESQDYMACRFKLNDLNVVGRTAKITPTKAGQFVTLWKRSANGPIQPFEVSDPIDLFVINVSKDGLSGQFIFPKVVLLSKGVVSGKGKEGKRAMRVYPPWDTVMSKQAEKTQRWQTDFFTPLSPETSIDYKKLKKLYLGT